MKRIPISIGMIGIPIPKWLLVPYNEVVMHSGYCPIILDIAVNGTIWETIGDSRIRSLRNHKVVEIAYDLWTIAHLPRIKGRDVNKIAHLVGAIPYENNKTFYQNDKLDWYSVLQNPSEEESTSYSMSRESGHHFSDSEFDDTFDFLAVLSQECSRWLL